MYQYHVHACTCMLENGYHVTGCHAHICTCFVHVHVCVHSWYHYILFSVHIISASCSWSLSQSHIHEEWTAQWESPDYPFNLGPCGMMYHMTHLDLGAVWKHACVQYMYTLYLYNHSTVHLHVHVCMCAYTMQDCWRHLDLFLSTEYVHVYTCIYVHVINVYSSDGCLRVFMQLLCSHWLMQLLPSAARLLNMFKDSPHTMYVRIYIYVC